MQNVLINNVAVRKSSKQFDRRTAMAAAVGLLFVILAGFGPTYYFHPTEAAAKYRLIVHLHALMMTTWVVLLFIQTFLIRAGNVKLHMRLGIFGVAIAILVTVSGIATGIQSAKNGFVASPPGAEPLAFLAVPFFTIVIFAILFAAAIYYRKKPGYHKRLMLLTAVNFSGAAIARIPIESLQSFGPLWFLGAPLLLGLILIVIDTIRNRRPNPAFAAGMLLLAIGYPFMILISGTAPWLSFAEWMTRVL